MYIESLDISSYRSITRPMKMTLSPLINIFIGQNNSGKTNLLDAIDGICQGERAASGFVKLTLSDGFKKIVLDGQTVQKNFRIIRLLDQCSLDFEQVDEDYQSLAKRYPEKLKEFHRLLSVYFPELSSSDRALDENLQNVKPIFIEYGETISIDRLGSGFQKIFVILLYALHPDYPVVLLDEPETHLHPALIKKLRKVLASGATNQVIMTTHSPLFISADNLHQVYRVVRTPEQGTHYHQLIASGAGINKSRMVQELNADNLEMFFADRVLLVEGVSDQILMQGLLERFYRGPLEIKVVYTHGKGNTDIYMTILKAFHIRYIAMLDKDAMGWWTTEFLQQRRVRLKKKNVQGIVEALKQYNIYVLPNGTIEKNYPRKYQKEKKKPLNALQAANHLTLAEYNSNSLSNLREIINALINVEHDDLLL